MSIKGKTRNERAETETETRNRIKAKFLKVFLP